MRSIMPTVTWRKEILAAMEDHGETWADVVSCTLTEAELDWEFENDYGSNDGLPFTLWTHRRTYFPTDYYGGGSVGVASVSRAPDGVPTWYV